MRSLETPFLLLSLGFGALGCEKAKPEQKPKPPPKPPIDAAIAKDAATTPDAAITKDAATTPDAAQAPDASLSPDPAEWDRCTRKEQCTSVSTACAPAEQAVNKRYEKQLQQKLDRQCKDKALIAILGVIPTLDCVEGRCVVQGPNLGDIGGSLDDAFKDIAVDPSDK